MNYNETIADPSSEDELYMFLKRYSPAIIHISGENYNEFTRRFQKPFDELFISVMQDTLKYLCSQISDCVYGYTSEFDLILVLKAPEEYEQASWFGYDILKTATLSSSMATLEFNRLFEKKAKSYVMSGHNFDQTNKLTAMQGYVSAIDNGAFFTAKCFNISKDRVFDYFHLRQKSCIEKGIIEAGRTCLPEKEITGRSPASIQFSIYEKTGINFDNYPSDFKRGSSCLKTSAGKWIIDKNMPMLKSENRDYIDKLIGYNIEER